MARAIAICHPNRRSWSEGGFGERAVSRYLGPQMFSFGRRFVEGNFAAIRFVRLVDQPFRYATPTRSFRPSFVAHLRRRSKPRRGGLSLGLAKHRDCFSHLASINILLHDVRNLRVDT